MISVPSSYESDPGDILELLHDRRRSLDTLAGIQEAPPSPGSLQVSDNPLRSSDNPLRSSGRSLAETEGKLMRNVPLILGYDKSVVRR